MPNQNDPTQNPKPVTPPVLFPQTDLPPLPPEFQNLDQKPVEEPAKKSDSGSATPPDISSVIPKPKKKFAGGRIIATILGLFLLIGGVGAGIVLTQQPQLLQQKADMCCATGYYVCNGTGGTNNRCCKTGGGNDGTPPYSCGATGACKACSNGKCAATGNSPCSANLNTCTSDPDCESTVNPPPAGGGSGGGSGSGIPSCPITDCQIGSNVPGAIQCKLNDGSTTYCCPTSSPLYNSSTNTCGASSKTGLSACPDTDCQIDSSTPGAVHCILNDGSASYCCPTSSPLYNSTTKTCGAATGSCTASTSVNTYGNGYKKTVPAGTYGCTNAVSFDCATGFEADLGRYSNCTCYPECTKIQTDCSKEVAPNCSQSPNAGSCYVTTSIGVALDGCPCIGPHYTTCATGYICSNQNCVPAATIPPSSSPNTPTAPSCVAVKAYDANFASLTTAGLSALTPGAVVNFCVSGANGNFDQAQFKIGNTVEGLITTKRSTGDFCQSYTIQPTDTTVTVSAKIHDTVKGWVGEVFQ